MKKPLGNILGVIGLVLGAILILAGLSPLMQAPPAPPVPEAPATAAAPVVPTSEMLDNFAPDTAVGELDRDVTGADADLNKRTLHIALGFATGGFAQDPVAQRAMSETGQQILRHLLLPGDTISMFGFEKQMGPAVWNLPFGPQSSAPLAELWGQLKPGEGGIDFNQAIISALPNLQPQNNHNTVLVLLSPWDTSQSAASDRTPPKFADLSPALLENYGLKRMAPFKIPYHQKAGNVSRFVYMTIVLPTHFTSDIRTPDRQSALAQTSSDAAVGPSIVPVPAPAPPSEAVAEAPRAKGPLVGIGVLFLILGLVCLLLPSPASSKISLSVGGGSQDFYGPWKSGEVICRIVGSGLPADKTQRIIQISTAPAVVLAEIQQGPDGPLIRSEHLVSTAGGQAGQSGYLLRKGPRQSVTIEGISTSQPDRPPFPFSILMEITLT